MTYRMYLLCSMTMLAFISGTSLNAQDFQLQWMKTINGSGNVYGARLAVDPSKNLYVGGTFAGTVDFDPGSGTANLTADTAVGAGIYFLAKYDAAGNLVFVRQMGAYIADLILDKDTNIYLAGAFLFKEDFDPGSGAAVLTSAGGSDLYVAKYSPAGHYISAFGAGGEGSESVNDLALDADGNVYITGDFGSAVDFDPGPGTVNLSSAGDDDIFLAKYSRDLAYIKAINFKATGDGGEGVTIAFEAGGNIIFGGRFFQSTIDLDPGPGTISHTATQTRGFVARYTPAWEYISAKVYPRANIYQVVVDGAGNVYETGTYADSVDMDPGPGKAMIYSKGLFDSWVAKFDASGNYLYANTIEGEAISNPLSMAVSSKGDVYLAGKFGDSINLNPKGVNGRIVGKSKGDSYLAIFDASGKYTFGSSFPSTKGLVIGSLLTDMNGRVWLSGNFSGTVDFDLEADSMKLTSTPSSSIFFGLYLHPKGVGLHPARNEQSPLKIYGADDRLFVDFSALQTLDAKVEVVNMLGQVIAEVKYKDADRLQLDLPQTQGQVYLVIVTCNGVITTRKIWVY